MSDRDRKAMLAKTHIAKKELALSDEDYRAIVARVARGRSDSAGKLTLAQLHDLLAEFKRLGWRPKAAATGRGAARDPQSRMARGIWIELCKAGVVRDPSEQALRAYVKRMTGCDDLRFCDPWAKSKLIEALLAWAARCGVEVERG